MALDCQEVWARQTYREVFLNVYFLVIILHEF